MKKQRTKRLCCPVCKKKLIPRPVYDNDTVNGVERRLNPNYIYFSCECGYIFARQSYAEFHSRVLGAFREALNYPEKDWQGAVLPLIHE